MHLHPDHSLDHTLCLVPIQLIIFILHPVFLRRILFVWVAQTPTTYTPPVVIVSFNIGTPVEINQP
jgi:hypothetical protein